MQEERAKSDKKGVGIPEVYTIATAKERNDEQMTNEGTRVNKLAGE